MSFTYAVGSYMGTGPIRKIIYNLEIKILSDSSLKDCHSNPNINTKLYIFKNQNLTIILCNIWNRHKEKMKPYYCATD
jgi:hypothetical protein